MGGASESSRVVARIAIAALCAGALLLILAIATGSGVSETGARAIGTAVAVAFFSLTGVAGTNLARRRPEIAGVGYLTVAASVVALLTMTISIWSNQLSDGWRPAIYTLIFAFAVAHTSVLLAAARANESESIRLVRGATILALTLFVILVFVEIASPGPDIGTRGIAVVAVLYALGALVLALLRRAETDRPGGPAAQPRS